MADFAIVVGIQTYPELGNLHGPCNDAVQFTQWLTAGDGGGLDATHVQSLLTTQFPAPSSVADARPILSELGRMFQPFIDASMNPVPYGDRLFIFMAGHGFSDPQSLSDAALFTADATQLQPWHVATTAYAEWLKRHFIFREIALIMDCCRTTTPLHRVAPPMIADLPTHANAPSVKTFYAFATQWGRVAREKTINGETRGIFTTTLLEALKHAAPNDSGQVTGMSVKNYIHNTIHHIAGQVTVDPPDIYVDHLRDFVFSSGSNARKTDVSITIENHQGDETLLITNGSGQEEARIHPVPPTHMQPLLAGLYKATLVNTSRSVLFEVPNDTEITI